ncbi:MAG TPA: hypothetical protein VE262_16565 [Blastocatellia bacterium]|nr:hypothetical protein [Blastocatellia bacterium]
MKTGLIGKSLILWAVLPLVLQPVSVEAERKSKQPKRIPAVMWRDPGKIEAKDLRYGPGSAARAPAPPFRFLKEDKDGESPKFKVKDSRNVEWSVKLGPEAQTETVATRLLWAVGYFAEESYYFDRVRVQGLPRLSRGMDYVEGPGTVRGVRFEPRRPGVTRADTWDWNDNPFAGRRELSGLKMLMILLNNYDARTANNHVLLVRDPARGALEARYVVTDVGATLGRAGGLGGGRSKNDLEDFLSTEFVMDVKNGVVIFDYDTRPKGVGVLSVLYPPYYLGEVKKEKDMRDIPVSHARWLGRLLARVSNGQLRDAFTAAGYDPETREAYVRALRQRMDQLSRL